MEHDDDHAYLISQLVVGERFDRTELTDEQAVRAIAAVADALATLISAESSTAT